MEFKEILRAIATFNWSALCKLLSFTWTGTPRLHEVEPHLAGLLPRASVWLCAFVAFLAAILAECYAAPAGPIFLESLWDIATKDGLVYVTKPALTTLAAFGLTMFCLRARARGIERWANIGSLMQWAWLGIFIIICLATAAMTLTAWTSLSYLNAATYPSFKTGIMRRIIGMLAATLILLTIYWTVLTRCYRRLASLLSAILTREQKREVLLTIMLLPALILMSSMIVNSTVQDVRGDPARETSRSDQLAEVSMTAMACAPSGDNIACVMNLWTGLPQDYTLIGPWTSHATQAAAETTPTSSTITWTPEPPANSTIAIVKLTPMEQFDIEIRSPRKQACAIVRASNRSEQLPAVTFEAKGHENGRVTEERRTIQLRPINVQTLRNELIAACEKSGP